MAWLAFVTASLLTACKTPHAQVAKLAIITDSSSKAQQILRQAASKAVGSNVTLAPDSFTAKPSITIEPASVNKRNSKIIDGRTMEMPTQIDLMMIGRECYIVNRTTGKKHPVKGVKCRSLSNF